MLATLWQRVPVVLLFVTVAVFIFSHLHRAKHFLVVGSLKHFPLDDAGSACDFDIFYLNRSLDASCADQCSLVSLV